MMSVKPHSTAAILLALSLYQAPLSAQEADLGHNISQEVDYVKPFAYSLSLMAVGLPTLIGVGAFEGGPSVYNFTGAFRSGPVWDNDPDIYNFILHPLWGSETYLRAREANWGIGGSIGFSMGMSVTWEYLVESWVEHPSAQDLIFTTGIGWVIGEVRYKIKQSTDRWDWAVDPINTTLEHFQVKMLRNGPNEVATVYSLAWDF